MNAKALSKKSKLAFIAGSPNILSAANGACLPSQIHPSQKLVPTCTIVQISFIYPKKYYNSRCIKAKFNVNRRNNTQNGTKWRFRSRYRWDQHPTSDTVKWHVSCSFRKNNSGIREKHDSSVMANRPPASYLLSNESLATTKHILGWVYMTWCDLRTLSHGKRTEKWTELELSIQRNQIRTQRWNQYTSQIKNSFLLFVYESNLNISLPVLEHVYKTSAVSRNKFRDVSPRSCRQLCSSQP